MISFQMNLDDVEPSLLRLLMSTLSRCLHSDDKFHIVRSKNFYHIFELAF